MLGMRRTTWHWESVPHQLLFHQCSIHKYIHLSSGLYEHCLLTVSLATRMNLKPALTVRRNLKESEQTSIQGKSHSIGTHVVRSLLLTSMPGCLMWNEWWKNEWGGFLSTTLRFTYCHFLFHQYSIFASWRADVIRPFELQTKAPGLTEHLQRISRNSQH